MERPVARSLLALLLLVPAPSLGAWCAYHGGAGSAGQAVYFAAKLWLVFLPLVWQLVVEREPITLSPLPRERLRAGLATGFGLGVGVSLALVGLWLAWGERFLDAERLRATLATAGLSSPVRYLFFSLYLALVNSLVEEYVWRWFVFRQCERWIGKRRAVPLAALFFTLHHGIAFQAQFGAVSAALATAAVFAAGCAWSWCYARYRSIWPGWISHALIDATGLALGWRVLFP